MVATREITINIQNFSKLRLRDLERFLKDFQLQLQDSSIWLVVDPLSEACIN